MEKTQLAEKLSTAYRHVDLKLKTRSVCPALTINRSRGAVASMKYARKKLSRSSNSSLETTRDLGLAGKTFQRREAQNVHDCCRYVVERKRRSYHGTTKPASNKRYSSCR